MIVDSVADNNKISVKNYWNGYIEGIHYGINSFDEFDAFREISGNIEKRIIGGRTHIFFEFQDETYNDINDKNKLEFYNKEKNCFGSYVLEDTDGVVRYVECDDNTRIYISNHSIRIDGETWSDVKFENLSLIYEDGMEQDILKNDEVKALSSSTGKNKNNASTFIEYKANKDLSKLCEIKADGNTYEVVVEEIKK